MPNHDKALVTLLIGDPIRSLWQTHMEKGWRLYAEKNGYDIVIIDEFIDKSPLATQRSPHWQKCLILQHPSVRPYKHAVWIDADITINHFKAPSIVDGMSTGKVGCVATEDKPGTSLAVYEKYGVTATVDQRANSGVLVMQPALHTDMMDHIYRNYGENANSAKDNVPLSFHLFESDMVEPIDPRFNVDWTGIMLRDYAFLANFHNPHRNILAPYCLHAAWCKAYFLHFISQSVAVSSSAEQYNTRQDIRFLYQEKLNPIGFQLASSLKA